MKLSRRILTTALVAVALLVAGDSVFVLDGSKVYHTHKDCMTLKRSKKVVNWVQAEVAVKRGLRACGICARRKGGK